MNQLDLAALFAGITSGILAVPQLQKFVDAGNGSIDLTLRIRNWKCTDRFEIRYVPPTTSPEKKKPAAA